MRQSINKGAKTMSSKKKVQKRGRCLANSRKIGHNPLGRKVPKAQQFNIDGIVCWLPSSQVVAIQDHSVPSEQGAWYDITIPVWLWASKQKENTGGKK